MKKYIYLLIASVFIFNVNISAQKKFKFEKVSRDTKKEAKRYEKDGFMIFPGNLPIRNQLDKSYSMQTQVDDEGFPKWIVANGSSVAQTQSAAEMQAVELAKNRLVGLLETNMKAVIESDVSNNQLNASDAASITKTIEVSANRVSKKLQRVNPLFKVYRKVKKNTEVQVLIGYSYDLARKAMLDEAKLVLQQETEDVRKKHEKFLIPETYEKGEIKNYAPASEIIIVK